MALRLRLFEDARSFLDCTGSSLYAAETVNNLILGISELLVRDPGAYPSPFFAAVLNTINEVRLAAVMTPPHHIVLAGDDPYEDALPLLIDHLRTTLTPLPGVTGPAVMAESFSHCWQDLTGSRVSVVTRMGVYELQRVAMPELPPGIFRVASSDEGEKITLWFQAFQVEALGETHNLNPDRVQRLISDGNIFVWEREGDLVSMAMKSRPIARSITVSGVYTPPEHRRKGYASALVAHLSQHLLDLGYQFVNLFTDLANPTSNAIYQHIGYQPVCEFRMIHFEESMR